MVVPVILAHHPSCAISDQGERQNEWMEQFPNRLGHTTAAADEERHLLLLWLVDRARGKSGMSLYSAIPLPFYRQNTVNYHLK